MSSEQRSVFSKYLKRIVTVVLILVALFLVYPSPIDPVAYQPPTPPPMAGALEPNTLLRKTEILARGKVQGPEDVDVDDLGRIYGGTLDGRIVRILPDGAVETFATTGGRPLGMDFDHAGNLIVCDADRGLLSIAPDGAVTVLATEAGGVPFKFADDVEVALDGAIYFSDASDKFGKDEYMLDLMEGRPHGRLLRYDPVSRKTEVLQGDLYFANGIAADRQGDFVLVNETYRYRISRYWLRGPKAGKMEPFIENLPGFPDGISSSPRGTFWLALFTARNPTADRLSPFPFLRKQLAKLPHAFWPVPEPYGFVVEIDRDGKILRSLQDPGGQVVSVITSVHEENGTLYFGTLLNDYVGRYRAIAP